MRKLFMYLFPLLVFWAFNLSVWINLAYAVHDKACYEEAVIAEFRGDRSYYDHHSNHTDAMNAILSATGKWSNARPVACDGNTELNGDTGIYAYEGYENGQFFTYWASYNVNYLPPVDTDGDGVPDDIDFYPDDQTPYLVRKVGEYLDEDGNVIATEWETSRGDTYTTGDGALAEDVGDYRYYLDEPWTDPSPDSPITDADFPEPGNDNYEDYSYSSDGSGSPPPTDSDSEMQSGESADPTPDPDADPNLSVIANNTKKTADNTKRLGDYANQLNQAVDRMDYNIAKGNQNTTDIKDILSRDEKQKKSDRDTGTAAKGEFDSLNVGDYYNGSNYSGEITSGVDYDEPESLGDQSWLTSFIDSNPYKSALDNSGFNCSGGTCTATLSLGLLGTHTMSICEFDSAFSDAGSILLGLTTLGGLILLVKG